MGYPSGSMVYLKIVPVIYDYYIGRYYDFDTEELLITGISLAGASPEIAVTVP